MYSSFYGFSERPFDVTPDPRFLYSSRAHREALASLIYGIRERRGFIAVLGEAGTGKTTVLRSLLDHLGEDVKVAYIFNTDLTFEEMLHMVLMDLGLADEKERLTKAEAIHRLNDLAIQQLARGGNLVLIVDEAQDLDRNCLENLRLLSNLETSRNKLIQIILSGQPELEEKLNQADLRQLSQRINLRRRIPPLDEKETHEYIDHRLKVAQYDGPSFFTKEAEKLIWLYSGGIPRMINTVCDNALLIGYAIKTRKIGDDTVQEVIDDLTENPFSPVSGDKPDLEADGAPVRQATSGRPRFRSAPLFFGIACLSLLIGFGLGILVRQLKGDLPLPSQNKVRVAIPMVKVHAPNPVAVPRQPSSVQVKTAPSGAPVKVAAENTLPDAPDASTPAAEEMDSSVPPKQPAPPLIRHEAETQVNAPTGIEADSKPIPKSSVKKSSVIRTRKGDTLFRIIISHYGTYDKTIEGKVLAANPEIMSPSRIYPGQRITMPDIPQQAGPYPRPRKN